MLFLPSRLLLPALAAVCLFVWSPLAAAPWVYTPGSATFNPPSGLIGNVYPPGSDPLIPMQATVSENPAQITLTIYSGTTNTGDYNTNISGTYDVLRKGAYDTAWTKVGTVTVGAANTTWTDASVSVGQLYEYALRTGATSNAPCYGCILTGIKVDQTLPKGRIAVVVSSDVLANLPAEYAQYKADLAADGWTVHEILTTRAADYLGNGTGPKDALGIPTGPFPGEHVNIRNQIIALYNQYPGEFKNVTIVGKVAAPLSGTEGIGPDGHGNMVATGADAYYADMDGVWTDKQSTEPFIAAGTAVTGFVNNADGSVTLPSSVLPVSPYYYSQIQADRLNGGTFTINGYPYNFTVAGGNLTGVTSAFTDTQLTLGTGQINLPGDNKFDANYMEDLTPNSNLELGFGRIDFGNAVPGEYAALKLYFNKLHRYKSGSPDFQPGRRAGLRGSFGMVARACLAAMPGVVGMSNLDFIRAADLPSGSGLGDGDGDPNADGDAYYTQTAGPYLFYFKGSGTPGGSAGSKAMIWTGMQSHWGYWSAPSISSGSNSMQRRVAEDNYTLSYTWSIGNGYYDTSYLYHRMGMGLDTGDMMRISMSARGGSASLNQGYTYTPTYFRTDAPLFMEHIGDPALRLFMFAPASALSVVKTGGNPALTWTASPEPTVIGYHVYRAAGASGPFTRLTSSPVAGTAYTDASVSAGSYTYMVRAVRLETTGGGTFYNASLGVSRAIDLTNAPAPVIVPAAVLPDAFWSNTYSTTLAAQGGTPVYQWSLVGGALPSGLTLAPNGTISGASTAGGLFTFTAQAADQLGQTAQGTFTLNARSNNQVILYPEANDFASSTAALNSYTTALKVSGPSYNSQAYARYNLSGVNLHNGFVSAQLVLTANEYTNTFPLLKVGLTADSSDGWSESSFPAGTYLPDNPNVPPLFAPSALTPFGTLQMDVTPLVQATLAGDPAKKLGLHFYTTTPASFGNEVQFVTRYGPPSARPTLILQTTDAPAIAFQSPAVNPAAVPVGAVLRINAAVTPIPARAGSVTLGWSKVSGPGTVAFSDPLLAATGATFSAPGDYVLRLTANDGVLQSTKDLTVRVLRIAAGTAPAVGPTDSLLLRLALDEAAGAAANDTSGVSPANSGTLATIGTGGALPAWVPAGGRIGGALNFDGSGERVEMPESASNANPLDGMQKLTVSLWVKLNATDTVNSHAILSKRASTSASSTSYAMDLTNASKVRATVYPTTVTSSNGLAANQWTHLLMTFDGTTKALTLYLNGSPEVAATSTVSAVPRNTTSKLRIGDYTITALTGAYASLNGQVDEVRVYNRVLTASEIEDLASAAPADTGPLITLANTAVSANAGQAFALGATVSEAGGAAVSLGWTAVSGPGGVSFDAPASAATNATAASGGQYVLRLSASDGLVTTSADVLASIAAVLTPYQQWLQANGYPIDGSGNGAPNANPSGDGIVNALKYALGLTPSGNGYQGRLTTGKTTVGGVDYLSLTYVRPEPAPSGVVYAVETSPDLLNWSAANTVEVSNTAAGGLRTITVRDSQGMSPGPARFIHLRVTLP